MQIALTEGKVVVTATIATDMVQLIQFYNSREKREYTRPARKKYTMSKQCDICGKSFRGNRGVNLHKVKLHQAVNVPVSVVA